MTIYDASGQLAGEDDVQWMGPSILHWLSEERTQRILLEQRVFSPVGLGEMMRGLSRAALAGMPIKPEQLRAAMLKILSNRVVRIRIAADILRREYENRAGYEIVCREFPRVLDAWSKASLAGQDCGPRPEDPRSAALEEIPPPQRHRSEIMRELRDLQLELETSADSKIERPL